MKSYTNLEQSKELAEILPITSADHHYVRKVTDFMGNPVDGEWSQPKYGNPNSKYANYIIQNFTTYETIPCWSLAALLHYLKSKNKFPEIKELSDGRFKLTTFIWDGKNSIQFSIADNLVDACYEMILKLHEQKLL